MNLLLAVMSYEGANSRHDAHFPFWQKSGASAIIGIGTTDGKCRWPEGMMAAEVGRSEYINGDHLPQRLIETMELMLLLPYDRFCIIEWDCLFFKPMPEFSGMVGFHAGNQLEGMRARRFYHVPWGFDYDTGHRFVVKAKEMLPDVSGHECSPDVFFGWVCQEAGIEVTQPWEGFTRNTIESAQDAEDARNAYRAGIMALHGCKGRQTLDYILS